MTVEPWDRRLTKSGMRDAACLKPDEAKGLRKHRFRVHMVLSLYQATHPSRVASFACQCF